ncbi:MAG: LysR family transcriptional regulator [Geminicoccaceae bacterium]
MDRIAGMEAFAAVVETGGFQSAARQLGVSRALVSKRVAGLEADLGVQLLRRTTRKLSVTGPGADFYERCRRILGEFREATGELTRLQREPRGVLKVNGPMSFGQLHLAAAMVAFMCDHPQITVQLTLTDRFVDVVEEGYDIVLRIGALRGSSLIARRLCPIRRVLCASPDYLAGAGTPAAPADLSNHRLLQYGLQGAGQRWQLTGPEGDTTVDVPPAFCVNNGDVLRAAAQAGLGIVLLPTFICGDALRSGELVRVLPQHQAQPIALHALWVENRVMPSRLRRFLDFLVARFGAEHPAWDAGTA